MSPERYRIDWALQCVYEYNPNHDAYCYLGSFAGFGITSEDSSAQAVAKCEKAKKPAREFFRVGDIVNIDGVSSGAEVIQIYVDREMEDIELKSGILKPSRLRLKVCHTDHNSRKLVKWFDSHMVKLSIPVEQKGRAKIENKKQGGF